MRQYRAKGCIRRLLTGMAEKLTPDEVRKAARNVLAKAALCATRLG
jgi:hypothetical protein